VGETTGIAWTDSTINVWHGCEKVSPGCKHCYAEVSTPVRVKRAAGLEVWGPNAARVETKSWAANLKRWNREAAASGKVHRVFGQSLADTFEDYHGDAGVRLVSESAVDGLTLDVIRAEFFRIIEQCPALTFQLLTKRPENILRMVPPSWLKSWPRHVWIGCTVEDQEHAEKRIPHLLRVPAAVRFLSVEPQIGPVDMPTGAFWPRDDNGKQRISWVIQGGESGLKARPFDLAWARSMRDRCKAASVPYFLKQLGANPNQRSEHHYGPIRLHDSHGGDESEWPADLRGCRAFPEVP
jgi:protein gp37